MAGPLLCTLKRAESTAEFPLTELRRFLWKGRARFAPIRRPWFFADALRSYFDQLREIAREFDEEYVSDAEPVLRT